MRKERSIEAGKARMLSVSCKRHTEVPIYLSFHYERINGLKEDGMNIVSARTALMLIRASVKDQTRKVGGILKKRTTAHYTPCPGRVEHLKGLTIRKRPENPQVVKIPDEDDSGGRARVQRPYSHPP